MALSLFFWLYAVITALVVAQDPPRPYPLPDSFSNGTSILNHSAYVADFDEPQWYLDNIPFVDIPDPAIQKIYYYRFSVLKRHLTYTHEGHGWIFTEFIQPVPWSSKFQTIPDSAAHQIMEARWLRDPSYGTDTIEAYTRGGVEVVAGITYTHYIHDAILEFAEVTGDAEFLTSQLDGMISTYHLWDVTRDNTTGLYHRTPLLDAQEYSLPGWLTGGPNDGPVQVWNGMSNNYSAIWLGPETYRPNFNAYMIAGARAISTVAGLAGNVSLASEWNHTASTLYSNMQKLLWHDDTQFWIDVVQGTNMDVVGRQLVGLFPHRFGVGTEDKYLPGLEAALGPDVFLTEFGPTTLEQTNPYFTALKNTTYCCLWNGQSWPFSTSVYLGTLARLAREDRSTVATPDYFVQAFSTYTRTHSLNKQPFIAEAHYPTLDAWSGYTTNHSEHYLHSTYIDNFFSDLIGIIPTLNNTFEMSPLIPSNWTHFLIENLMYHGTLLTILYDADNTHYSSFGHDAGLSIFADGNLLHTQPTLTPLSVPLPFLPTNISLRYVNILSNPNAPHGFPRANTSATSFAVAGNNLGPADDAYKVIDGLVWYDLVPDNFWSNNQSTDPGAWINVTMARPRSFSSVTVAVLDDSTTTTPNGLVGGSVKCPAGITVVVSNTTTTTTTQSNTSTSGTNQPSTTNATTSQIIVINQNPWTTCVPNARNTLEFPSGSVTADTISLYLTNALHYAIAIAEIEIWISETTGPRYEAEDALLGFYVQGRDVGQNGTIVTRNGVRGVVLMPDGILEWGGVTAGGEDGGQTGSGNGTVDTRMKSKTKTKTNTKTNVNITVIGTGGSLILGMNYLRNVTVDLSGQSKNGELEGKSVEVDFLPGRNVVTLFNEGKVEVFVDAIVVG